MATMEEKHEKCKQEPQIILKLNENTIQMPFSTFDAIVTEKVKEKLKDLHIGSSKNNTDFFKSMGLNSYESKYKSLISKAICYQEIINSLKRDLKHNKFAQPKRPLFDSCFQNIHIKTKAKKKENVVQVSTLSNEEYEPLMTVENSTNTETIQISSENNCDLDKLKKNKADLELKTTFVQIEEIDCFELISSDESCVDLVFSDEN